MKEKNVCILKQMLQLSTPELIQFLRNAESSVLLVLCECFYNVHKGNVKVKLKDLDKYEKLFRSVLKKNTSLEKRRALFLTKSELYNSLLFELIQLIIRFCFVHIS